MTFDIRQLLFPSLPSVSDESLFSNRYRSRLSEIENSSYKIADSEQVIQGKEITESITIIVEPNQFIPCDGTIILGTTTADETLFSPQAKPSLKERESSVLAGTLNRDSVILVRADRSFCKSSLSLLANREDDVDRQKPSFIPEIKRHQNLLRLLVVLCMALFFLASFFVQGQSWLVRLALALIFTALLLGPLQKKLFKQLDSNWRGVLKWASLQGLAVRDTNSLEIMRHLKTVFFDKTGTLTRGAYAYAQTYIEAGNNLGDFLATVFSLESGSDHPLAKAIETHPWYHEIPKYPVEDLNITSGLGLMGTVVPKYGKPYKAAIGNLRYLKRLQYGVSREMRARIDELEAIGETVLLCGYHRSARGMVSFADISRPTVRKTWRLLQRTGIEPAVVTGDSEESLAPLFEQLEIKKVYSRCTPDEKQSRLIKERDEKKYVGFVGTPDDKVSFKNVSVSFAINSGYDAYKQEACVNVMNDNLALVGEFIKGLRDSELLIKRKLWIYAGTATVGNLLLALLG